MKQEYFVVVLAHSIRGRLRRIHVPHQAVYAILALALLGCFSVFGFELAREAGDLSIPIHVCAILFQQRERLLTVELDSDIREDLQSLLMDTRLFFFSEKLSGEFHTGLGI